MSDNHIKIPEIEPVIRYTANGVETEFAFPFPIFATEDITLTLDEAEQQSGFTIQGAGSTDGGSVIFTSAPAEGVSVVIERKLPLERMTDFLESGDFSARSLNNELDYLMASMQQVSKNQNAMLRFPKYELDARPQLPDTSARAGRALAFDEQGDPIVIPHGQSVEDPVYIPFGAGAVNRTLADKAREIVTPQDFGAKADGVHDDTQAIRKAIQALKSVVLPAGRYRITGSIELPDACRLRGRGEGATIIEAATQDFPAFIMQGNGAMVIDLSIEGAQCGVEISSDDQDCTFNLVQSVTIKEAQIGILIDAAGNAGRECAGNRIDRVTVQRPSVQGVVLRQSNPAALTPENTHFSMVNIVSDGQAMSGEGVLIDSAIGQTLFERSVVNVDGTATACIRLGDDATNVTLNDVHTISTLATPNIVLNAGSSHTVIYNLNAGSNGVVIDDASGGEYCCLFSDQFDRLKRLRVTQLSRDMDYLNTISISASTILPDDIGHVIVSGLTADITLTLPDATMMEGAIYRISRTDSTNYLCTITPVNGATIVLGNDGSHLALYSDGTQWLVRSQSRVIGRSFSYNGGGVFDVDMAADIYLLSPTAAGLTAILPAAATLGMKGRSITVKNENGGALLVTENGALGPDGAAQQLNNIGDSITVTSDGSKWLIVSDFTQNSGGGSSGFMLRTADITGSGTITLDTNYDFFVVNNSAGAVTLVLPDPTLNSNDGRMIWVKKTDTSSYKITFTDVNGNPVDGNPNYFLDDLNECFSFCAHNGTWRIAHLTFF